MEQDRAKVQKRGLGLYQKGGKGTWYVRYKAGDKWLARSTESSDFNQASLRAAEILRAVDAGQSTKRITVSSAFQDAIDEKLLVESPEGTIINYQGSKKRWESHLGKRFPILRLTKEDIDSFISDAQSKGNKLSTIRHHLILISTVLNRLARQGIAIPPKGIFPRELMGRKTMSPRKRFLTREEIDALLFHAQDNHRDYILGYLYTGCRLRELFQIRKADIDYNQRTILIRGTKNDQSFARIPLALPLAEVLKRRTVGLGPGDPVYPPLVDLRRYLKRACERAGIEPVTCHDLRRTTGSLLCSAGVDIRQVAFLLRHKDINTTIATYGHLTPRAQTDIVDRLPTVNLSQAPTALRKRIDAVRVGQFDPKSGELLQTFATIAEAVRQTKVYKVGSAVRGEQSTAGGFVWKSLEAAEAAE